MFDHEDNHQCHSTPEPKPKILMEVKILSFEMFRSAVRKKIIMKVFLSYCESRFDLCEKMLREG